MASTTASTTASFISSRTATPRTEAWKTPMGSFGEMHGKIEGNLLRYEWKERRIGAVGADATKEGKGYFVLLVPKEGEAPEIHGEWGLGQSDAGNSWEAVKQKNKQPDLKTQAARRVRRSGERRRLGRREQG